MIKVYNRTTNYLRADGKSIAPLKTEEFEERTPQIRVLERNGSIVVSENLDHNIIPHSTIKEEIKEEKVIKVEDSPVAIEETKVEEPIKVDEVEVNEEETKVDEVEVNEEDIIPEEEAKKLEESEVKEVKAEKVTVNKKKSKSKKGGNK